MQRHFRLHAGNCSIQAVRSVAKMQVCVYNSAAHNKEYVIKKEGKQHLLGKGNTQVKFMVVAAGFCGSCCCTHL